MKDRKLRVLFVCTGNICRSPTAEGILKNLVSKKFNNKFDISSAGVNTYGGMKASAYAVEVSKKNNIDISSHLSSQINEKMVSDNDLIFVMAQEHLDFFKYHFTKYIDKVYLLKKFENPNCGNVDIIDPIGGSIQNYEKIFYEIENEIERVFPKLIKIIEDNE